MFGFLRSPLVAACLIVIGLLLVVAGNKHASKFAALRDHGKVAKAEIVKLEWREKKSTHADSQYTAHIRFTTEDGREIRTDVGVPAELGRDIRYNRAPSAMNVRYLPEAPSTLEDVNRADPSDEMKGVGRIMVIAGLVLLGIKFFLPKGSRR